MTNPVILLGTQSNGETLPVQVDATGRLVAEGLQGPPGVEGPPGIGQLPADPYEGAILGWLNGELSWIGPPPVPIPEYVFGPITSVDPQTGLLTVAGELPSGLGSGVYCFQCSRDGTYYTNNLVTGDFDSTRLIAASGTKSVTNWFDGNTSTQDNGIYAEYSNQDCQYTFSTPVPFTNTLKVYADLDLRAGTKPYIKCNGTPLQHSGSGGSEGANRKWYTALTGPSQLERINLNIVDNGYQANIYALEIDGKPVVDRRHGAGMRINQVINSSSFIGTFLSNSYQPEVGQYLRVDQQYVARWLLYGNDPTTDIDLLR
jgi:hypothetical protein